jgi:hypothetical protein
MDRVAEQFSWLVGKEGRPIAYFVDDIDRCQAADVVELLESVQTLVRDAGGGYPGHTSDDVISPCFVVAGDGAWIRKAFEERYDEFTDQIAEPGKSLGYLFLAKFFQLRLPVPRPGRRRRACRRGCCRSGRCGRPSSRAGRWQRWRRNGPRRCWPVLDQRVDPPVRASALPWQIAIAITGVAILAPIPKPR